MAAEVSGRTYVFEANDQGVEMISLDLNEAGCKLTVQDNTGSHQVRATSGAWFKGTTTLIDGTALPVAASGAWTSDDTYVIRLCFYETPFCPTLTYRFSAGELAVDWEDNVSFGPTEHPQIIGRVA